MGYQSALGRIKGMGSAHKGAQSWIAQRVTAVVLALLFLWFAINFALLLHKDFIEVQTWIAKPLHSVLLITFIIAAYYHAIIGMQAILEDYLSKIWLRIIIVNIMYVSLSIFAIAAILSIIKIAVNV